MRLRERPNKHLQQKVNIERDTWLSQMDSPEGVGRVMTRAIEKRAENSPQTVKALPSKSQGIELGIRISHRASPK